MNGQLFFEANSSKTGMELWKSDGTATGTVVVKDIQKGSKAGHAHDLLAVGNTLYFSSIDATHGLELWKSDGTAAGTVLVKDINRGQGTGVSSFLTTRVAVGNTLYFVGNDGIHGMELWKTDGTAAGTVMLADINPGTNTSNPRYVTAFNGKVYFTADDGVSSVLWVSDGTAAGTTVFHNIAMSNEPLQVFGGRLYYQTMNDGGWSSDGTAAGTAPTEFRPLVTVNGQTLYAHSDPDHGEEPWIGDGTALGTSLLNDIWPGTSNSFAHDFIVVG
jgi:ELWxxDGT repeat protein